MQNWIFDIRSRPFVLLIIAFVVVSLLVFFEVTEDFDQAVSDYFHSISGNLALDLFMESVTEVGDVFYMLIFAIALIVIKRTRKIGITLMILLVFLIMIRVIAKINM